MIEKSPIDALQDYIDYRADKYETVPCSVDYLEGRLAGTGVSISAFNTRMKDAGFKVEEDLKNLRVTYSK